MLLSCSGMFYPKLGQCTPSATGTAEPAPVKCIVWDVIKCRGGGIGGREVGLSIPSSLSHSLWRRSEWGAERQAVLLQRRPLHMDTWSKERGSPRRLQCLCCKDFPPHPPCPHSLPKHTKPCGPGMINIFKSSLDWNVRKVAKLKSQIINSQ